MNTTARVLFPRPVPKERRVFSPTPTDEEILKALGRYTYLRIDQLDKLVPKRQRIAARPPKDPYRYLQQRTNALRKNGYVCSRYLAADGPTVRSPAMFWLDAHGLATVRDLGYPVTPPPKNSDVLAASSSHLRHTLLANDLLILAELLCRAEPERFWLDQIFTERELGRKAVPVTLPDGTKTSVKPDGFSDLRIDRGERDEQMCACWELDNGSEYRVAWFQKLQRLLAFAAGPYQAWAGTTSLVIPVVAATGPARAARLLSLTEEYLTQHNATTVASLFRFCSLDPTRATPQQLFLQPVWYIPFQDEPVPLVLASPSSITTTPLDLATLQVASGMPTHYMTQEEMAQFLAAVES